MVRYKEISRGVILGDDSGMFKMLFHREDGRLLGCHCIGSGATELIHIGQAVLALGGGLAYFLNTVFNYPTLAECYKVAAYNAQSWLADRLARHYLNANDLHDLLRSFAELSGTLIRQADGGLRICLQRPDIPLHQRALAGLCAELNLGRPV